MDDAQRDPGQPSRQVRWLIDYWMSSLFKIGLGYGIQSNADVLGYEEEISRGRVIKGFPHPLSGDYTPREQEDIEDTSFMINDDPIHDHIPDLLLSKVTIATTKRTQPQVPKPKQTVVPSSAQHNWESTNGKGISAGILLKENSFGVEVLVTDKDRTIKRRIWQAEALLRGQRVFHAEIGQATPAWTNTNRGKCIKRGHGNVVLLVQLALQLKSGVLDLILGKQNFNSGSVQDHPLKHMEHRGIFDSGCSGHMTGNRAHLEDYQELSKLSIKSASVKVKSGNHLILVVKYYLELERMLQAQLGHEKGHASCHLLIGCKLVVSNDVVVNLL
ncbi:hypothetical protein Tco_0666697 [Tanacetum coccineum]